MPLDPEFEQQVDRAVARQMGEINGVDPEDEANEVLMNHYGMWLGEDGTYHYDESRDASLSVKEEPTSVLTKHKSKDKDQDLGGWNGHNHGYTGSNVVAYKQCRHEAKLAFKLGGIEYYGGSEMKIKEQNLDQKVWLIVSCLGSSFFNYGRPKEVPNVIKTPGQPTWLSKLASYGRVYRSSTFEPQVAIDWSDMGAPPLEPEFWVEFHRLVKESNYKKVLFFCFGGHGRTGTALASLLIMCSKGQDNATMSALDAYNLIRAKYCEEAIESKSQGEYLNALAEASYARSQK